MKHLKIYLTILLMGALSLLKLSPAWAQTYPVQVSTFLSPPFSVYLTDYSRPELERFATQLFLADNSRDGLDVRLVLRLEGPGMRLETSPNFRPSPIYLPSRELLRLTGAELAEYFQPQNLIFSGLSQSGFISKGQLLPQGLYKISIEVLEYNRGVKISNTGTAMAWLILNDPPLLNLPAQNSKVRLQEPQNIVFQWTPRHTGSPNSAFTTEYEFTLVEIWPENRNPNEAIRSTQPLFQTTTTNRQLVYGPAEPLLEPGRRYAWRVQAKAQVGTGSMDLFKNEGYSEVYSFQWGDACIECGDMKLEPLKGGRIKISWQGQPNHTGYTVRYRPKEEKAGQWYEKSSMMPDLTLQDLPGNTLYEFMVSGSCGTLTGPYTNADTVRTLEETQEQFACGLPLGGIDLSNQVLLGSLKVGDVVTAGDFKVHLTKVSPAASGFSGDGVVEVPFMNKAKVKVNFENIQVNEEYLMVAGNMNLIGGKLEVVPQGVLDAVNELDEALAQADSVLAVAQVLVEVADSLINVVGPPDTGSQDNTQGSEETQKDEISGEKTTTTGDENSQETTTTPVSNTNPSNNGPTGEGTNNTKENAENKDVYIVYEGVNYKDGDVVVIPYLKYIENVAFQLKDYPEGTKSFKWTFQHEGIDRTIDVQNSDPAIDNFGFRIYYTDGKMKLSSAYDDKVITVTVKRDKIKFNVDDFTVTDGNNAKRIAHKGETLYLVQSKLNETRKITYNISTPAKSNNLWYNDPKWETTAQEEAANIIVGSNEFSGYQHVNKWPTNFDTKVTLFDQQQEVKVETLDQNKIAAQVIPPVVKDNVDKVFKNLELIKKVTARFNSKDFKIEPSLNVKGSQANIEDPDTRFYKVVRDGSINAGVTIKYSVPLPAPYSFDLTIPILDYSLGEVGAFIDINTSVTVNGNLKYERRNDQEEFKLKENSIGATGTGGMNFGGKIYIITSFKDTEIDFKAYGTTSITVTGKYILYREGDVDRDKFDVQVYFDPLVGTVSGKIKAGGYVIFDNSISYQLIERIQIYP